MKNGETPYAFVVVQPRAYEEELITFSREKLAHFKA